MSIIIDIQPQNQQWVNQDKPVILLENESQNGLNVIQASGTGVSIFTQQLNTLYGDAPILTQLTDIQFSTYRDSNIDNKDWYLELELNSSDQNINPQEVQARIYPRNSINFQYYSSIWMSLDKDVIQVDIDGVLSTFSQFIIGPYSLYKVVSVSIGTENLADFNGLIGDISVGFNNLKTLQFVPQVNVNNVVLGGYGSLLSLQNNKFTLQSSGVELLTIDGDNRKISLNGEINLLGPISNNIDMGGKNLINIGTPVETQSLTTQSYVQDFFNQLSTSIQWFNSYLGIDSQIIFTQNNLSQNISLLDTVNPQPVDDIFLKLSDSSFRLKQSNFRIEITLNIQYETLQSQPVSIQIVEVDVNGQVLPGSLLSQSQTTLKPFGLNQFITTSINTILVIPQTSYFVIKITSTVPQVVTVQQGSRFFINKLFDQTQDDVYQPVNTLITPINKLKNPNGNLSLNSNKIVNLAEPTHSTDAVTKNYVDSTFPTANNTNYYDNQTPLNSLILPISDLNLNNRKITNLADSTLATDALNKQVGDSRYYQNIVKLNEITIPDAPLNLSNFKITNLADSTVATDAINRQTADGRYYQNTIYLNNITTASSSLNLNSQKITDLADATLGTDGLNQQTADNRYYLNNIKLNNITAPNLTIDLNNKKITNLADATLSTDALNRQTGDSRYYLNTVALNSITTPNGSLDLNNQKISNLLDPVLSSDALNRQTGDGRYYQNTVTLNSITAPTGSLDLNNQKITNIATPTLSNDISTKLYIDNLVANASLTTSALSQYIRTGGVSFGYSPGTYTQIPSGDLSGCITSAYKQVSVYTSDDLVLTVNYNLPFTPIVNVMLAHLLLQNNSRAVNRYAIIQKSVTSTGLMLIMRGTVTPGGDWRFNFVFINPAIE